MSPYMRRQLADIAFGLVPLVVFVLVTKPALRQSIKLRTFHVCKEFCQANADVWQALATSCAQAYQNARM